MERLKPRGTASLELIVAGVLMLVLMTTVARVTVASGQLWQETRTYRLASSELATQMERLTLLSPEQIGTELTNWKPTPELLDVLPGLQLTGQLISDESGDRLQLSMNWQRRVAGPPLVLIGWLVSQPQTSSDED